MTLKYIIVIVLVVLIGACVDPFEIKNKGETRALVVEGVLSNQLKRHEISLTRTTSLTNRQLIHETGAAVKISDQHGLVLNLEEVTPGVYQTPEFAANAGDIYTLSIVTADGSEYASDPVPFKDGPDIGDLYVKYINNPNGEGKGLQVLLDTEDPQNNTRYYRWNYIETYEVHAPFPSVWVWVGGNSVEPRRQGLDTCYVTDTLRNILLKNTESLEQDKITALPIRYIEEQSYLFRYRYSILVQQFCLSRESYVYWNNLKTMSEDQGGLSDIQPGSLSGNMFSVSNSQEIVLGYFDVGRMSEKRIFFNAIDFYDEGLKFPINFRSHCYEIAPILVHESKLGEAMERYERDMYIWEVFGFNPNATFQLMPKICCDCSDQGPHERPPFF